MRYPGKDPVGLLNEETCSGPMIPKRRSDLDVSYDFDIVLDFLAPIFEVGKGVLASSKNRYGWVQGSSMTFAWQQRNASF